MGILVILSQVGNLITSFIVPSIEAAQKIRSLFEMDASFTVNLYSLTGAALTADDQALALINEWRASKNLPPLPAEIPPMAPGTAVAMPIMLVRPSDAPSVPMVPEVKIDAQPSDKPTDA